MEDKSKRSRGRPPAPPEARLDETIAFRSTKALKEKVERYGHAWARKVLTKAPPPKDAK